MAQRPTHLQLHWQARHKKPHLQLHLGPSEEGKRLCLNEGLPQQMELHIIWLSAVNRNVLPWALAYKCKNKHTHVRVFLHQQDHRPVKGPIPPVSLCRGTKQHCPACWAAEELA